MPPANYPQNGPYGFQGGVIDTITEVGGIYLITNGAGSSPIYAGQTDNLRRRLKEHFADRKHCCWTYQPLHFFAEAVSTQAERLRREKEMIQNLRPVCNS